jgi:hypothetical protein
VKLWAPDHPRGCLICLVDGRTLSIPNHQDGIEVSTEFLCAAIARGCEPIAGRKETMPDSIERATAPVPEKLAVAEFRAPDSPINSEALLRGPRADREATTSPNRTDRAASDDMVDATLRDQTAKAIMHRLQQAGDGGLTRTQISGIFKRNLSAVRIGASLQLLRGNGCATCETVRTEGRPTELWKASD